MSTKVLIAGTYSVKTTTLSSFAWSKGNTHASMYVRNWTHNALLDLALQMILVVNQILSWPKNTQTPRTTNTHTRTHNISFTFHF